MTHRSQKPDWIGTIMIPFLYLVVVLLLDCMTARTTITPLFGIIGLLVFAFTLSPSAMVVWASMYSVTVVTIFINPELFHLLNRDAPACDGLTPFVRSATFVAGAVIASLLCVILNRLRESLAGLNKTLETLPVPVITSDADGRIQLANKAAADLVRMDPEKLKGASLFDHFADPLLVGATIADYLRRFSVPDVGQPMRLKCGEKTFCGETRRMSFAKNQLLMIILSESTKTGL
jgi:PAS domain S-box-containing protein